MTYSSTLLPSNFPLSLHKFSFAIPLYFSKSLMSLAFSLFITLQPVSISPSSMIFYLSVMQTMSVLIKERLSTSYITVKNPWDFNQWREHWCLFTLIKSFTDLKMRGSWLFPLNKDVAVEFWQHLPIFVMRFMRINDRECCTMSEKDSSALIPEMQENRQETDRGRSGKFILSVSVIWWNIHEQEKKISLRIEISRVHMSIWSLPINPQLPLKS